MSLGLPSELANIIRNHVPGLLNRSRGDWKKISNQSSPKANRPSVDRLSGFAKAPTRERPLSGARSAPPKDFDDYIDFIAPPRPSVTRSSFSDDVDFPLSLELPSMDFGDSLELSLSASMSIESLSSAGVSKHTGNISFAAVDQNLGDLESFRVLDFDQLLFLCRLKFRRMSKRK
jgi:hypothetical protein